MLAIRLSRTGKKHQAYFRVVVSDSRRTPTAKFVEILGNYDPHAKKFQIDKDRLDFYLKNGAQPSNTVAKLLKNEKIDLPKWVKIEERNRAPKKAVEEKAAPKTEEKPAEEATETEEVEKSEDTKEEAVVAEEAPSEEATEAAPAETEEEAK
jgi:small subunit ribosomal protein S16